MSRELEREVKALRKKLNKSEALVGDIKTVLLDPAVAASLQYYRRANKRAHHACTEALQKIEKIRNAKR